MPLTNEWRLTKQWRFVLVTTKFFVGSIIILSRLCWLNIHTGILSDVSILKNRRKLQINEFNRKPVKLIWGDQHRKELKIPQIIINDYNHWMLGFNVANQIIAYYWPKIWCCRTRMPIFLHCLDILLVNSYILYKEKTSYQHLFLTLIIVLFESTNIS